MIPVQYLQPPAIISDYSSHTVRIADANDDESLRGYSFHCSDRDHLIISGSTYSGTASTVTIGQTLPGGGKAVADGTYPEVFNITV